MGTLFVGDIGTTIFVETSTDLTGYSDIQLNVVKPSNTKVTWSPVVEDLIKGTLKYTVKDGDFSEEGQYLLWVSLTFNDGSYWSGELDTFSVSTPGEE